MTGLSKVYRLTRHMLGHFGVVVKGHDYRHAVTNMDMSDSP